METFTKNAADLFRIAVNLAGFDKRKLLLEIHRLQGRRAARGAKANVATVERAMQILSDRFDKDGAQ